MPTTDIPTDTLLRPGFTCWRKARATRAALIIDAADYFKHLRALGAAGLPSPRRGPQAARSAPPAAGDAT